VTDTYPVIQVALDLLQLDRALQIAEEAVEGGVEWIEAGTPLIKSEGMEAVRALKKRFPGKTIVADMKIMDTGAFEVEMATKAGADVVGLLGASSDDTIKDGVRAARKYGAKLMVDLIAIEDKVKRGKEAESFGADLLCVHVGVDEQMAGRDPVEELRKLAGEVKIPIAVAGGLNSETAPKVVEAGASIVIIGGAITKHPRPTEAAQTIMKAIEQGAPVSSDLYKKYGKEELVEAFTKVSSSNVSDAQHHKGSMWGLHHLIAHKGKMVGRALTVRCVDGDWAKAVEAIDKANAGDVIVIDTGGGHIAIWGELASWSAKTKGLAGVVIDGAVRDVQDILDMDFPVFARYIVPHCGEPKGVGEIGAEVEIAGVTVRTGDWVIGDESGVTVVEQERAVEVANRALDVLERENRLREEIQRGSTLSRVLELYKWEKVSG